MLTDLTIALDMMGGDYGPRSSIPAAVQAVTHYPRLTLLLCGDQQVIEQGLLKLGIDNHPRLIIHHCTQVVTNECQPVQALRHKRDSSMRIALEMVASEQAEACVSAGNTGALFSMAYHVIKMLPGIKRPALISSVPTETEHPVYLLDLGANVHCDAQTLFQFAVMGSIVAEQTTEGHPPKVCLLNIGAEDIKGYEVIKQAANLMKSSSYLNYQGYCEGSDMFSGKADVVVCEGFVGNVALKTCEGIAHLIMCKFSEVLKKHFLYQVLAFVLKPIIKKLYRHVNPEGYNGAILVGLRGVVVKSHGNASQEAFFAAIEEAICEAERSIPKKIQTTFAAIAAQSIELDK